MATFAPRGSPRLAALSRAYTRAWWPQHHVVAFVFRSIELTLPWHCRAACGASTPRQTDRRALPREVARARAARVHSKHARPAPGAIMSTASEGEAAVAAMLHAARQTFEAMRQTDGTTRDERVQAIHAVYEQQWARVRRAAEALDSREPHAAQTVQADNATGALLQERRELRATLLSRNRELKEQIDGLRELLCAAHVSSAPDAVTHDPT